MLKIENFENTKLSFENKNTTLVDDIIDKGGCVLFFLKSLKVGGFLFLNGCRILLNFIIVKCF